MKFKIGDKVVIKNNNCEPLQKGELVEIIDLFPEEKPPRYECATIERQWCISEEDLEGPFITNPIDYTGCHPDIAAALKRGESILCRVRDNKDSGWREKPEYIIAFSVGTSYPYLTKECYVRYAEPVTKPKTITKVKKASEIVKWLEDNGYEVDEYGDWMLINNETFLSHMFQFCDKEPTTKVCWLPEWLEEVEC